MRRLVGAGRALLAELDAEAVLQQLLRTAKDVTAARYAALGVLDDRRAELARFVTLGLDAGQRRAIGDLPRGHGVLGVLIDDPRPLRLADVGSHPRSYGFPGGHPPMTSFLGVPIVVRGEAWGNLYLTDKEGGEFDEADEEAVVILADWAAIALENARLFTTSERRRRELERALRGLQATQDVAIAIGDEAGLDRVLEIVVKRGRALVDARSFVILLRDGATLVVAATAGHAAAPPGARLPIADSVYGHALRSRRAERVADPATRLGASAHQLGTKEASSVLLVPLVGRGEAFGVLAAFDREGDGEPFGEDDEQALRTFAASAAVAVGTARSVHEDRLRLSISAAEAERQRWARELHDETLQALGALRVLIASSLRRDDPARLERAAREAVGHLDEEIEKLRALITELRPAALDEFGLLPAIEALVERRRASADFEIESTVVLPDAVDRLSPDVEATVYRVVQEALTNVAKHALACRVRLAVHERADEITVEISDDGVGLSPGAEAAGFGLTGMRERVRLFGGTHTIDSGEGGTRVQARVPTTVTVGRIADLLSSERAAS
jgi:signal transduction histidine kinase